ncbi:MAG: element excision factor XisH family protein [Bacteroidota bacterium]
MSRRDLIHDSVRTALENDGWTITDDPLYIPIEGIDSEYEIDLAAERFIVAEKSSERIAVEVKSFAARSVLNSFHTALGQYLDYQAAMRKIGEDRILYLAVGEEKFEKLSNIPLLLEQIETFGLNLLIIDIGNQIIKQWA